MSGYYWLASYPKSGNTWLRLALRCIKEGGAPVDFTAREGFAPIASARDPFDALLGLESSDLYPDEIERLRPRFYEALSAETDEPLLRKVHDAWVMTGAGEPLFPPPVTLGAIYVVRDPRDVVVSLAYHYGITIDAAAAMMADPEATMSGAVGRLDSQLRQRLLTWSSHVQSWLDEAPVRLLCLRYEEMKAAPHAAFAKAAAFLGLAVSSETIAAAVLQTRFEALQDAEKQHGFRERSLKTERFFRRGEAGGWRDSLTAVQAQRIVDSHGAVMAKLGYI